MQRLMGNRVGDSGGSTIEDLTLVMSKPNQNVGIERNQWTRTKCGVTITTNQNTRVMCLKLYEKPQNLK